MSGSQALISRIKSVVPVAVKRPVRRAIPYRYHRYFDPEWHRRTIGNLPEWEYMGRLQLDYLVEKGLEPSHTLLDVGCGPFRAGIHFIDYLEPGHYAGVDKRADVIETARTVELVPRGLDAKSPALLASDSFEFGKLGMTFDYAMAQSVFTHIHLNAIMKCLVEMGKVLRPGGRFYASIFENPHGKLYVDDIQQSETAVTHYERDFYHYDLDTLRYACEGTGLTLGYEGDYGHQKNEKMLVFTRDA